MKKNCWRKIVSFILCIVLFLTAIIGNGLIVFANTNHTLSEALAWVKAQENVGLDYDNAYGNQCVDLIFYYYQYLGVNISWGNGCDFATNNLPSGWSRVQGGVPQAGDILVYTDGDGRHSSGHVAIQGDDGIYHQNWGYSHVICTTNRTYSNLGGSSLTYWGYIRPDWGDSPSASHEINTSYGTEFGATANVQMEVWDANHNVQSGRKIDAGDECTIHEVYTDGCCYVTYPSSSSSTGTREAYASISNFSFTPANSAPVGSIDSIGGGEGIITVSGWAFDPDDPSSSIPIHVYIDGPAGEGTGMGAITANVSRPDVNEVYGISGNHGYDARFAVSAGTHSIYVYAIDGVNNPCIGSGTVTVAENQNPVISDVQITNITSDSYTITCNVSDASGISSVKFPTWNTNLGTEKAVWYEGTVTGNTATCTICYNDLGETTAGQSYLTHIYAYDIAGATTGYPCSVVTPDKLSDKLNLATGFADDFYAVICNKASESTTVQGQPNACVLTMDTDHDAKFYNLSEQENRTVLMHFKKNSDGSYRISPVGNESLSLDVDSGLSTNLANVEFYANNDSNAQKWYLYEDENGCYLSPACAPTACLDMYCGNPVNGTNASLYNYNTGKGPVMTIQALNKVSSNKDFYTDLCSIGSGTYLTSMDQGDISETSSGSVVSVIFSGKSETKKQTWHLVYNETYDAYYIHPKGGDDYYLHVVGGGTTRGTAVGLYQKVDDSTGAQLWDVYKCNGHYYLKPQCSSTAFLDVNGMSTDDVDAEIWDFNFNQGFDFTHTEHTWNDGEITTAATYEQDGVKTFTCTVCGQTKTESIPKITHNYATTWSKDANTHWHACTDEGYTDLKADEAEHSWNEGIVTKEATYEEVGVKTYTCTVCGQTKTESIPLSTTETKIQVEDQTALIGSEIIVPVKITKNPGIAGFSLKVNYDSEKLTLNEISNGTITTTGSFSTNDSVVNWYTDDDVTADGDILNLHFTVNDSLSECDTTVSVALNNGKLSNLTNSDSNAVSAEFESGTIHISEGVLGDVTGDQDVAINDVVKLNKAVLGKTQLTELEQRLGDVTGDQDIAINDVVKLNKYVLGKITVLQAATVLSMGSVDAPKMLSAQNGISVLASQDPVSISAGKVTVSEGNTVDIPVIISGNTGLAGLALEVNVPTGITVTKISKGELVNDVGSFTTNVNANAFSWYGDENLAEDGVLAYITCSVEDGLAGTYPIEISLKDNKKANASDEDYNPVAVEFTAGSITVPCKEHSWDEGTVTQEATYEQDGVKTFTCTVCGQTKTESIPKLVPHNVPTIYGNSLTLDGTIGANFYVNVPSVDTTGYYATLTRNGVAEKTITDLKVETLSDGSKCWKLSYNVAAKEMTDEITLQIFDANNNPCSEKFTYSVTKYSYQEDGTPLTSLVKSMRNYGGYAQTYWGYNTTNLANAGLYNTDTDPVLTQAINTSGKETKATVDGSVTGVSYYGTSLLLESDTVIRHYFTVTDGTIDDYKFCLGTTELTPTAKGDYYYIDIANIAAKDLDQDYTLTIQKGTQTQTITYNALRYVYYELQNTSTENLTNLCKAIYFYNQAADSYFTQA